MFQSLMEANQPCFIFGVVQLFSLFCFKRHNWVFFRSVEVLYLYQVPQRVQIFRVSNILRHWRRSASKLTLKFQFMASQLSCNRVPTCPFEMEQSDVSREEASCFI